MQFIKRSCNLSPRVFQPVFSKSLVHYKTTSSFHRFSSSFPSNHNDHRTTAALKHAVPVQETIQANHGLSLFLRRVYTWSGTGVLSTIGLSSAIATCVPMESFEVVVGAMVLGGIGMFASSYKINKIPYQVHRWISVQPFPRQLSYAALVASTSLMISPLTWICFEIDPLIMPTAALFTAGIMGGASLYAVRQPEGALLKWHASLYGALWGTIGVSVLSIGSHFIFGPNPFSMMWFTAEPYIGIALFTALTAHDTQMAIEMYRQENPDHIGCATALYLDAVNLLIRIMEIMAKSKRH